MILFRQDATLRVTWVQTVGRLAEASAWFGRRDDELFDPETAARLAVAKAQVLRRGDPLTLTVRVPMSHGPEECHVRLEAESPLPDEAPWVRGIVRPRVGSAEALAALVDLLDESRPPVCRVDAAGRVEAVNAAYATLLATEPGRLTGRAFASWLHPDAAIAMVEQQRAAIAFGVAPFDVVHVRADGAHVRAAGLLVPSSHAGRTLRVVRYSALAGAPGAPDDELLERVVGVMPGLLYVVDEVERRLLFVNREVETLLGYAPEELLALGNEVFRRMLHPDDHARVRRLGDESRRLADGAWLDADVRLRHRDGSWRWYRTRRTPFRRAPDGTLSQTLVCAIDITAERAAQAERRRADAKLRAVADADLLGIAFTDESGRYLEANDYLLRLLGRDREDVAFGRLRWQEITPPEWAEADARALATARARGACPPYEKEFLRPDGTRVHVMVAAAALADRPGEYVCVFLDRSDVDRQAALMEQTHATAHVGGWELDIATNAVRWTLETYRIHEVSPATFEPTLDRALDFYTPASRAVVAAAVQASLESGAPWDLEAQIVTAGGRTVDVRVVGHVDRDGTVLRRLYGSFQDITDRKRLEAALLQAQKMEGIGRLAGGIAHDFNNLLTVILGVTDLTLADTWPDDPLREQLQQIREAAERAAQLTRQLLAFARRQMIQPRAVDVNARIRGMERLLRPLLGEPIEVIAELQPGCWPLRADPAQLEQVLLNLAVNARDAMPTGGRLRITTANQSLAEREAAALGIPAGDYVRLEVADTGTGMDEATQAHIFEPFFTTKPLGAGTGLGLAVCYGVVQQSGGAISVDSTPGLGSRFTILLPRADDMEPTVVAPAIERAAAGSGARILLVEDDPLVRAFAERVLRRAGHRVTAASDGTEALALAEYAERPFDLLVCDLVMPRLGGFELARRLRARWTGLRVVLISGYTDVPELVAERDGPGGSAFLAKPFTAETLERQVREVLADLRVRTA
ncbi:MAG: PAS domain-containing protein [Gemmatimonadales bacterium]|nr:PAS domain-containing protein [Gemmatimonadales bacterium]